MKQAALSRLAGTRVPCGAKLAVASVLFAATVPAHAQFGALFQNIMQMQQQQQQAENAKREQAQKELDAKPFKKWPDAKAVPSEVKVEAAAFAEKVPNASLRPLFERLYIEGERNATLNFQRIGLAALVAGDVDTAEKAFEAAVTRIDLVYADNPEAQKAKSLWTAEKVKDFKGEPYERAMAYFYRGLVYAAKNDFQNARAMFKQADYQDTVAEDEKYAGDFALMPYMAGWASYCDGNAGMARDFLEQAAKVDGRYKSAAVERPVLVLYETGRVPLKYGSGKFGELLKWSPRDGTSESLKAVCTAAGGRGCTGNEVVLGADVGFQATTRGGRQIDAILNGKAAFKENAQQVADVTSAVSQAALLSGSRGGENLGLFGMFATMAVNQAANQAQAQADIREWEQLPNNVWLGTLPAKSSQSSLFARLDAAGSSVDKPVRRVVDAPACQLYWGRSVDLNAGEADMGPLEAGAHPRDPVFRRELAGMFGG